LAQFSPQPAAHRPFALLSLARGPSLSFPPRGPLLFLPRVPNWAKPSQRPGSHTRAGVPCPSLTPQARLSGSPPSSSHRRRHFPSLPMPNPAPNLPLSLLGAPSGYISKGAAPLRIPPALLKLLWCSRDRSPCAGALAAASLSHTPCTVHHRLRFHPW
jgi:hypothetical protein